MYATAVQADLDTQAGGRITEIIQHSEEVSLTPLLLPMLAQLSRTGRWLALISPPPEFDKDTLQQAGAILEHVWILRPDSQHTTCDLAIKALNAGTCHTVVSWHPQHSEQELTRLQEAAANSDVQGIVVRGR